MRRLMFVGTALALLCVSLSAVDYKVVVPQLSPVTTEAYQKLIIAIMEATGNSANVAVLPFARCLYQMETKQADVLSMVVPIPDKKKWAELKFDYSSAEVIKVAFVLYTNKAKPINVEDLKAGKLSGLKLETDTAHVNHFGFPIAPSTNIDASLKKVDAGSIDGYIFAQNSTDSALKRLAYKNIARTYFATFTGTFVLQKGGQNGPLDKVLVDGLTKVKANGKYQQIMAKVLPGEKFVDWQP